MSTPLEVAAELLALDEDNLFQRLGYQYGRAGADVGSYRDAPPNPQIEHAKGERLFEEMQPVLVQKICKEWDACAKVRTGQFVSVEELVVVIADIISAVLVGVPVIIVAVLVVKVGLRNLCECE